MLEVKVVLTSVVAVLALYQLTMAAIGYGRLRPRAPEPGVAFLAHRAVGDVVAALLVVVVGLCLAAGEDGGAHAVVGAVLVALLALKIAVVRRGLGLGRFLPWLGVGVASLLWATWALSAGEALS